MAVRRVRSGGSPLTHAVPSYMHAAVFPNDKLSTANGAHGHRAVRLTVDLDWFGKVFLSRLTSDVKDVSSSWLAFVVDDVDDAFGVPGGLRLNAIIGRGDEFDVRSPGPGGCGNKK